MKIVGVEAIPLRVPLDRPATFATRTVRYRDYVVVRVHTDEGIEGIGYTWYLHSASIIEHLLKDHILGEDPFAIEKIWSNMYQEVFRERKGAAIRAMSALDIAIWDIIGKALEKPLHRLLGGYDDKIKCYASGGYYRKGKGLEGLVEEMLYYVERGFKAVKMKVGSLPIEGDVERVKAVRDAVGPNVEVMLDANNGYNVKQAIKAGRRYERYNVAWLEEPVWPDDIKGSAKVAAALEVPVASGELEYTRYGFRDLIENEAVDIIQPDATVCGGVTEWMKIANMAEAWNIPVNAHAEHEIHVHLMSAIKGGDYVEYFHRETDITKEMLLFKQQLVPKDGILEAPREPGWGLELDEEALIKYRIC